MEEHNCPICGGESVIMGQLGNLVHARCRNCGMDFNWPEQSEEERDAIFSEEEFENQ